MEKKTINSNNVGEAHSEPPRSCVYVCIPRQNAIYVPTLFPRQGVKRQV